MMRWAAALFLLSAYAFAAPAFGDALTLPNNDATLRSPHVGAPYLGRARGHARRAYRHRSERKRPTDQRAD